MLSLLSSDDFSPIHEDRDAVKALAIYRARFQVNRLGRVFGVSIGRLGTHDCLSWLKQLPDLISFAVGQAGKSRNWFGDDELAIVRHLPKLKALAVVNCENVTASDVLISNPIDPLRWLTLAYCNISDEGVTRLSHLKDLFRLEVSGSGAKDVLLRTFADLRQLRHLGLKDTNASRQTIDMLARSLPRCRITCHDGNDLPRKGAGA